MTYISSESSVSKENLGSYIFERILNREQNFSNEQQKSAYEARLIRKVNSGAKLSGQEMAYLQKHMPEVYAKAKKIQLKRQAVEERLKACRSKQEVANAVLAETGMISEEDPDCAALQRAVQSAVEEFKKTDRYQSLPQTIQEVQDNRQSNQTENTSYVITLGGYQEVFEEAFPIDSLSIQG